MATPPAPAPSQQPVPTGTTSPGKRRFVLVAFAVLAGIVLYHLMFPGQPQPEHLKHRNDDNDTVASAEATAAAKAAEKYEAEQERLKREREAALRAAKGKIDKPVDAQHAQQPKGGGGARPAPKKSAPSIVFDLSEQGHGAINPEQNTATVTPRSSYRGDPEQRRILELARQIMSQRQPTEGSDYGRGNTQEPTPEKQAAPVDLLAPDPSWPRTVLPEDTVIEAVLKNRLEGANDGPVEVMVTTNVYQPGTHRIVFPQGTNIAGETKRVTLLNQERLAAFFHRALVQRLDGSLYDVSLHAPALDQAGAVALHDKVNHHYLQIFGASLAVGAIGGLANIGNTYGGLNGYDALSGIRAGIGSEMGMSTQRIMTFYLNELPTIVIREGTRVKIMLTADLEAPLYPDQDALEEQQQ